MLAAGESKQAWPYCYRKNELRKQGVGLMRFWQRGQTDGNATKPMLGVVARSLCLNDRLVAAVVLQGFFTVQTQ